MKLIISLAIAISISHIAYAESECPKDWPVTLVEKSVGSINGFYLKSTAPNIKENKIMANREMPMANAEKPYIAIQDNEVNISLVLKNKDVVIDEKWVSFARIEESQILKDKTCHKLSLVEKVELIEAISRSKPDCPKRPKWRCETKEIHKLRVQTKIENKNYHTDSIEGISVN